MSVDFAYLQLKAKIIDFLRANLVVPQAYSEIYNSLYLYLSNKLANESSDVASTLKSLDPQALSSAILQCLFDLVKEQILVSERYNVGRYHLSHEYLNSTRSRQDGAGADDVILGSGHPQNISVEQFFEYLQFLAQVYDVANGSFRFDDQDLDSMGSNANKIGVRSQEIANSQTQCLIKQITYGVSSQTANAFNDADLGHSAVVTEHVLVEPFAQNFIQFNRGISENKRFILGLPLLVIDNPKTNKRNYIPVFYYSINQVDFVLRTQVSLSGLVGPFVNKAFLDVIDDIFIAETKVDRAVAIATRESFMRNLDNFLSNNQGGLEDFSKLVDILVEAYAPFCSSVNLMMGNLTRLISLSEVRYRHNRIVLAAIMCQASCDLFKKQVSADFKTMIDAGPEELKKSALRYFFADTNPLNPNKVKIPVFNTFAQESKAAVVVDLDPNRRCDDDQCRAVRSMLKNEVTVLQGPPGTGKTMTVATAAFNHLIRGNTVLVTSYNNAAVDAFLEKATVNDQLCWAKSLKNEVNNSALSLINLAKDLVNRKNNANDYLFSSNMSERLESLEHQIYDNEQLLRLYNQVLNQLQSALDISASQILSGFKDSNGHGEYPSYVRYMFDKLFGKRDESSQDWNLNIALELDANKRQHWLSWIDELIGLLTLDLKLNSSSDAASSFSHRLSVLKWKLFRNKAVFKLLGRERLIWFLNQVKAVVELKLKIHELFNRSGVDVGKVDEGLLAQECLKRIQELSTVALSNEVVNRIKGLCSRTNPIVSNQAMRDLRTIALNPKKIEGEGERLVLHHVLQHFPVTASTLLSVGKSFPMKAGIFDLVIFDEAAQFSFIDALPIIYRAKRIAIIGDPQQLKPIGTYSTNAIERLEVATKLSSVLKLRFNINDTLFDFVRYGCACFDGSAQTIMRLAKDYLEFAAPYGLTSKDIMGKDHNAQGSSFVRYLEPMLLRQNRRSVPEIVDYISSSFYEDKLIAGRDIENKPIQLLSHINNKDYAPGMHFIHVQSQLSKEKNKFGRYLIYSREEIDITLKMVSDIIETGYQGSIGIIAPFRYHIDYLRSQTLMNGDTALSQAVRCGQVKIDTVHKFQGLDCDIIFYDLCLEVLGSNRFALDPNLFNVAMSRAKNFLFVVGNIDAVLSNQRVNFIHNLRRYVCAEMSDAEELAYHAHNAHTSQAIRALTSNTKLSFDTVWEQRLYKEISELLYRDPDFADIDYSLVTQFEYYNYRLDIALIYRNVGLDVECDGSQHYVYWYSPQEYECVASDIQRESILKGAKPLSFETIRFKNSLIDNNPRQCAEQVVNKFKTIIKKIDGRV